MSSPVPRGLAARRAVRNRNTGIRECLLDILRTDWPQPWSTPELRCAFRAQEYANIYLQLGGLAGQKLVESHRADGCLWWVYVGEEHWPKCAVCGWDAEDLVLLSWPLRRGGWSCAKKDHRIELLKLDWPWPYGEDLYSTLAQMR